MAILISDKGDFKLKTVARDKEGHFIVIKVSIHQEAITIINVNASNIRTSKYIKQMLTELKGEIESNKIITDFNTPLSIMNRTPRTGNRGLK